MTVDSGDTVWLLDSVGYDAGGGKAIAFATLDEAKARNPDVTWRPTDFWNEAAVAWQPGGWEEERDDGLDILVIYPAVVNEATKR